LCDELNSYDQNVFACGAYSLTDHGPSIVPPFEWHGTQRVTLDGTLAEWSPDAIGWLGAFLADLCAQHGVATPVLLTTTLG
jgi:hypothetical protein